TNFRVDRMEDVQILDEPAVPVPEDFNLPEYLNATFSMFSGDIRDVKLRFKEGLVNSVLDCFGWDVRLIHDGSEHFTVHVKVKAEAPFFGWLFQFGSDAQIISPPDLNERYLKMLHSVTQDIEQRTSSEEE
ncbi:MAG: WYL domain-containing protein, partial [Clostridia bacterium]|nr:WYL domain-containing protein [Clostridia bacterium]